MVEVIDRGYRQTFGGYGGLSYTNTLGDFEAFENRAQGICEERSAERFSVSARFCAIPILPLTRLVLWTVDRH